MTKRRLHLHGPLRELGTDIVEVEASTLREAIRALCHVLDLKPNAIAGRRVIEVAGFDTEESLDAETDETDFHLVPAFCGSRGIFQIIIGAILVVVGTLLTPISPAIGSVLISAGIGLTIGGLAQALFPVPNANSGKKFSYLGAGGNTTQIGTPIPLLLGTCQFYGQYISYNVDAVMAPT